MTEVAAVAALASLTTSALEIITAVNQAAQIINARHQRGGDFTPEELSALETLLDTSKLKRDAAIAAA